MNVTIHNRKVPAPFLLRISPEQEYKEYDKAVEYIKQIKDNQFFNYKIDMLKHMEKYVDALEVIISDKDYDKNIFMINDILNKRPDLKQKAEELFRKYNK